MCADVRKESNNLRVILKPFIEKTSTIEENDSLIYAPAPEFIVVEGRKFYLIHKTATEIKNTICPTCKVESSGFAVGLRNHAEFPNKMLVAMQCDSCKKIMVIQVPQKEVK